jgi:PAS domain S-box-containing protein
MVRKIIFTAGPCTTPYIIIPELFILHYYKRHQFPVFTDEKHRQTSGMETGIIMAQKKGEMNSLDEGIADNPLVMVITLERTGKIHIWNKGAEVITGYSGRDAIGSSGIWKLLYPDPAYRDMVTNEIAKRLRSRTWFDNFPTTIRTKGGDERTILWNASASESSGKPRIVSIGVDITPQRKAEQALEEREWDYRSVIEHIQDVFYRTDMKGILVMASPSFAALLGYASLEECIGHHLADTFYVDPATRKPLLDRISAEGSVKNYEVILKHRNGTPVIISANSHQYFDRKGNLIGVEGIFRDVTAQRKAELALIAYVTEMALRLNLPIGYIRDTLLDASRLLKNGTVTLEEMAIILDTQARNADQIARNLQDFQKSIAEKNEQIPEAYRKFLLG